MYTQTQVLDESYFDNYHPKSSRSKRVKVGVLKSVDQEYEVFKGDNCIGRSDVCDITINNPTISGKHAVIDVEDLDSHVLYDCGSTNGTRLDQKKIVPNLRYFLEYGNVITFGNVIVTYLKANENCDSDSDTNSESMISGTLVPNTPETRQSIEHNMSGLVIDDSSDSSLDELSQEENQGLKHYVNDTSSFSTIEMPKCNIEVGNSSNQDKNIDLDESIFQEVTKFNENLSSDLKMEGKILKLQISEIDDSSDDSLILPTQVDRSLQLNQKKKLNTKSAETQGNVEGNSILSSSELLYKNIAQSSDIREPVQSNCPIFDLPTKVPESDMLLFSQDSTYNTSIKNPITKQKEKYPLNIIQQNNMLKIRESQDPIFDLETQVVDSYESSYPNVENKRKSLRSDMYQNIFSNEKDTKEIKPLKYKDKKCTQIKTLECSLKDNPVNIIDSTNNEIFNRPTQKHNSTKIPKVDEKVDSTNTDNKHYKAKHHTEENQCHEQNGVIKTLKYISNGIDPEDILEENVFNVTTQKNYSFKISEIDDMNPSKDVIHELKEINHSKNSKDGLKNKRKNYKRNEIIKTSKCISNSSSTEQLVETKYNIFNALTQKNSDIKISEIDGNVDFGKDELMNRHKNYEQNEIIKTSKFILNSSSTKQLENTNCVIFNALTQKKSHTMDGNVDFSKDELKNKLSKNYEQNETIKTSKCILNSSSAEQLVETNYDVFNALTQKNSDIKISEIYGNVDFGKDELKNRRRKNYEQNETIKTSKCILNSSSAEQLVETNYGVFNALTQKNCDIKSSEINENVDFGKDVTEKLTQNNRKQSKDKLKNRQQEKYEERDGIKTSKCSLNSSSSEHLIEKNNDIFNATTQREVCLEPLNERKSNVSINNSSYNKKKNQKISHEITFIGISESQDPIFSMETQITVSDTKCRNLVTQDHIFNMATQALALNAINNINVPQDVQTEDPVFDMATQTALPNINSNYKIPFSSTQNSGLSVDDRLLVPSTEIIDKLSRNTGLENTYISEAQTQINYDLCIENQVERTVQEIDKDRADTNKELSDNSDSDSTDIDEQNLETKGLSVRKNLILESDKVIVNVAVTSEDSNESESLLNIVSEDVDGTNENKNVISANRSSLLKINNRAEIYEQGASFAEGMGLDSDDVEVLDTGFKTPSSAVMEEAIAAFEATLTPGKEPLYSDDGDDGDDEEENDKSQVKRRTSRPRKFSKRYIDFLDSPVTKKTYERKQLIQEQDDSKLAKTVIKFTNKAPVIKLQHLPTHEIKLYRRKNDSKNLSVFQDSDSSIMRQHNVIPEHNITLPTKLSENEKINMTVNQSLKHEPEPILNDLNKPTLRSSRRALGKKNSFPNEVSDEQSNKSKKNAVRSTNLSKANPGKLNKTKDVKNQSIKTEGVEPNTSLSKEAIVQKVNIDNTLVVKHLSKEPKEKIMKNKNVSKLFHSKTSNHSLQNCEQDKELERFGSQTDALKTSIIENFHYLTRSMQYKNVSCIQSLEISDGKNLEDNDNSKTISSFIPTRTIEPICRDTVEKFDKHSKHSRDQIPKKNSTNLSIMSSNDPTVLSTKLPSISNEVEKNKITSRERKNKNTDDLLQGNIQKPNNTCKDYLEKEKNTQLKTVLEVLQNNKSSSKQHISESEKQLETSIENSFSKTTKKRPTRIKRNQNLEEKILNEQNQILKNDQKQKKKKAKDNLGEAPPTKKSKRIATRNKLISALGLKQKTLDHVGSPNINNFEQQTTSLSCKDDFVSSSEKKVIKRGKTQKNEKVKQLKKNHSLNLDVEQNSSVLYDSNYMGQDSKSDLLNSLNTSDPSVMGSSAFKNQSGCLVVQNTNTSAINLRKRRKQQHSFNVDFTSEVKNEPSNYFDKDSSKFCFSPPTTRTMRRKEQVLFTTGIFDPSLEENVKQLGCTVVDNPQTCTVLVTDKIRRTLKLLCCVGRGIPVVSPNWVHESKRIGVVQDPWKYLTVDKEAENKFAFQLERSLSLAKKKLFLANYVVFATKSVKPPSCDLKGIVESCGGKFLDEAPKSWMENSIIISCSEDKSLLRKIRNKGAEPIVVTAEALLSGVLQQRLDVKSYKLG